MVLKDLLKNIDVVSITGDNNIDIGSVTFDSRTAEPGSLFVCIDGALCDGHDFAKSAVEHGACAVLAEKPIEHFEDVCIVQVPDTKAALAIAASNFYGNPANDLTLIGVTGTNGKTTVTSLIKSILEYNGKKVGLIGTNQNMVGDVALPAERTTPDALELNRLFSIMRKEKADYVVMEVSSHALALKRVYGLHFAVGIFTNLTQDHLDFHGTMENYMDAKRKLFPMSDRAVVNIDDPHGRSLLGETGDDAVTFSIDTPSDLRAQNIKMSGMGVIFDLVDGGERCNARINIPGRFSVYNALAAYGACRALGLKPEQITSGLMIAKGVKGRAEVVYARTDYTVLIDYAHTPDGLDNIIRTVREFAKGRVITLFGCGGDRDHEKRPIMGKIAGALSDYCIITSDNPRTEEPMAIIRQIEAGMKETGCEYTVIENRREAIRYALAMARKDDCVILAGKGHETYQILGTTKVHFDEREVVASILEGN